MKMYARKLSKKNPEKLLTNPIADDIIEPSSKGSDTMMKLQVLILGIILIAILWIILDMIIKIFQE